MVAPNRSARARPGTFATGAVSARTVRRCSLRLCPASAGRDRHSRRRRSPWSRPGLVPPFNVANAVIPVLLVSALIAAHGPERVCERWLGPPVAGAEYVAFGLTEPGSGSDAAALRTEAVADADGYLISGEKTSVTMYANSGAMVVNARTRRDGGGGTVTGRMAASEMTADGWPGSRHSWSSWTGQGSVPGRSRIVRVAAGGVRGGFVPAGRASDRAGGGPAALQQHALAA